MQPDTPPPPDPQGMPPAPPAGPGEAPQVNPLDPEQDDSADIPEPGESTPQALRLWDIQPGEPLNWYSLFVAYRDLGPDRSIDKAWRKVYPDKRPHAHPKVFRASKEWNWVDRARAFDLHLAHIAEQAAATAIKIEATRAEKNRSNFRENEAFLAHQGMVKIAELMALPLVQDTYAEQKDGKTIIHKRTVITPSHLFAMATLLKACSDIGRKGLGIKDDDISDQMTEDRFRGLLYRTTGLLLSDLPAGAMPPMPAHVASPPRVNGVSVNEDIGSGKVRFKPPKVRP